MDATGAATELRTEALLQLEDASGSYEALDDSDLFFFNSSFSSLDGNNFGVTNNENSSLTASAIGGGFNIEHYYQETIAFENMIGIVVPTVFAFIIAVGLVGNILVIFVVCRNHQMQNSTNTLIINLALSDLLFLVLCVPFTAADYALPIWVFSQVWCKILNYLQFVSAYASVWTLVLMSIDRFLAVVFPVQSMTIRTVRNTTVSIIFLWIVILVTNLPVAWINDIHKYVFIKEDRSTCTFVAQITLNATDAEVKAYYFTFNAFGYLFPLGIACLLYVFMLRKLWYGMPLAIGKKSEESIRAKKKVTWMVTGVIVTFAICWFPLNLCFCLTGLSYTQGVHPTGVTATKEFVIFQVTAQVLAYSNSCLNPILYAFLSENFRKAFVKIFGFLLCCFCGKLDLRKQQLQQDFERTEIRLTATATGGTSVNNYGGMTNNNTHTTAEVSKSLQRISDEDDDIDDQSESSESQRLTSPTSPPLAEMNGCRDRTRASPEHI